jgi:uncharacterized membrane protein YidH (DUF202 family)
MGVALGISIVIMSLFILSLAIISWQCYNKDTSKNKSQRYYSIGMIIFSVFASMGGILLMVYSNKTGSSVGFVSETVRTSGPAPQA